MTEQAKFSVTASSAIHTEGTCAYIIRCTSPISRSGGAQLSASQLPTSSIANATPPRAGLNQLRIKSVLYHLREQRKAQGPINKVEGDQKSKPGARLKWKHRFVTSEQG